MPPPDAEEFDPVLVALLQALFGTPHGEAELRQGLSLARLAKQTGLRQSTLRRNLTTLEEAGLVRVELHEAGGGQAALTGEGREFCAMLWGEQTAPGAGLPPVP